MSSVSLPPAVPVTSLRVFEPVYAFSAAQQARWQAELARDDAWVRAAEAERRESWRRLLRGVRSRSPVVQPGTGASRRPDVTEEDELAGYVRVLRVGRSLLLCPASLGDGGGPRRTLVRAWDLPVPWLVVVGLSAVEALGQESESRRAADLARELDAELEPEPEVKGGLERARRPEPELEPVRETVPASGWYLAPMAGARAAAARALRIARRAPDAEAVAMELEVLTRWLEGFHPRSWVELDARPVAALVGGEDGIEDIRLGMECLTSGDTDRAAVAYQRLRRRSRALTDISRLS
jgi:hypothetical protein